MPWQTQIYQACPGNSKIADKKRQALRNEIGNVSTAHDLFVNPIPIR